MTSYNHPRSFQISSGFNTISCQWNFEHKRYFYIFDKISNSSLTQINHCPVGWGCRIHRLHLCRGVRPPLTSVLDMTLNNLMVRFQQCWALGNAEYPFIAIAPRSTLAQSGSTWWGPFYGLNRTNSILMLKWIE